MLLSATSQFKFGCCICSHFIVAGNFKQSCNSKSNKGKSLKKNNCNMVTALQHLLQLGPSFLCSKALMIFIPHQIFRYLCDPRYLSNIQVGTRRKFGGAYKNERGKTFIVVSLNFVLKD